MHDHHVKLYESARADLDLEMKKLGFRMFHYVLVVFASQKERRQQLIILHVRNIIFTMFLLFSFHSSC